MIGMGEIFVILLVALLLFGGKRLPELARSMGQAMREFKRALQEVSPEIEQDQHDLKGLKKKEQDSEDRH